ncbi:MAG: flagellar protein FliT [Zoogloeaceae bacterium]|nr:flagellar protein FliT [Zoogloeaceae bacterium]
MASQIDIYEEMSTLSARMVKAARAHDWDNLIALEKSVAAIRRSLTRDDDDSRLSLIERDTKRALIRRILDDDAEIRRYTEPWMERLRPFFGSAVAAR